MAEGLLTHGAKVYISSRKAAACDETAKELSELGACIALPADVSTMEGIHGLADAYGAHGRRLDILINNAGAAWGEDSTSFPEKAGTR